MSERKEKRSKSGEKEDNNTNSRMTKEEEKDEEEIRQEFVLTAVEQLTADDITEKPSESEKVKEDLFESKEIYEELQMPDEINQDSTDLTSGNKKNIDDDGPRSTTSKDESPDKDMSSSPSLGDKEEFGILGQSRVVNTGAQNTPNQEVVTVKFILENAETFACAFKITSNIQEVKERLSDVLNLNFDSIKLEKDGFDVDDWLPLQGLGVEPFGSLELKLTSTQPGKCITAASVSEYIPTVDVITVHIWQDGAYKDLIVEIESQCGQKEWLGGYRNKLTELEYHHASTQTAPRPRKVFEYPEPGVAVPFLFHRDTQTPFPLKEAKVDTSKEKGTQVHKSDHIIPNREDRIVSPKPYQSYAEWLRVNSVEEKVIKIQRAIRHWLHRCRINKLLALQRYLLDDVKRQRVQMVKEQAEKEEKILNDPFPSKRDDFYMMYLMVGKWWQKEWQRICDMKTEEPKKAEFVALLEKEIKLLSAIEKHRIEVKQEAMKRQQLRFLEMSSRPLTFRNARGQLTTIDDPDTQRAREFKEVYTDLVKKDVSPKDRIDFLITLKKLMSNYTAYEYTKDIIKLIEREINLLAIGTKDTDLAVLRKRIEQLYMDFLHHPQFNPKVASYRKPNWSKKHDALYKCTRCMKLLPACRYPVHSRMKAYTVCKSCDWLQNVGHQRIDMTPFNRLLKQVQTSEMQKNCYSSVCFVFQQIGMFFLTSVVWHGHSAISECRDLSRLTHVRWCRDVEWSPWNTILLTEEEAECHLNIENVTTFYDKVFVEAVHQKHILARIHFKPLLKTDRHLRSTGVWEKITDIVPPMPKPSSAPLKPQIVFKE